MPSLQDDSGDDSIVSFIDRELGLLNIIVSNYETTDRITVRYDDPACRAHPLVGPIIQGALYGYRPAQERPNDRAGRLIVTNPDAGCSVLVIDGGYTFDLTWPDRFEVQASGVFNAQGDQVADVGALVGLRGTERRDRPSACTDDWGLKVTDLTFVEPPRTSSAAN